MAKQKSTPGPEAELRKAAMDAASWVTCSPHEWVWTPEQQVAMARYCLMASDIINGAVLQLERIVCVKEPDDGVVLLSNEGTSHYDEEAGGHVYDHEHFSPLGDALIGLHETLTFTDVEGYEAASHASARI